ncbi:MAG: hypothetical protein IKE75_05230 [Bacilli bacterium]|nr:hypothetical protein [Bacilli bacterium]
MNNEIKKLDVFFDYETGEITPILMPQHQYKQAIKFINDLKAMEANGIESNNINYSSTKRAVESYQKRLKKG